MFENCLVCMNCSIPFWPGRSYMVKQYHEMNSSLSLINDWGYGVYWSQKFNLLSVLSKVCTLDKALTWGIFYYYLMLVQLCLERKPTPFCPTGSLTPLPLKLFLSVHLDFPSLGFKPIPPSFIHHRHQPTDTTLSLLTINPQFSSASELAQRQSTAFSCVLVKITVVLKPGSAASLILPETSQRTHLSSQQ